MAKNVPPSPESYLGVIEALRKDIKGIEGFLSQEFVKLVTKYEGVIDVTNQDFRTAAQSLIHSDPKAPENIGRPVLSFTGTEQGIKDKVEKMKKAGVPAEAFTELLQEIATAKRELSAKISTNEGIRGLVETRVKDKLIEDSITLFASDGRAGLGMLPVSDKKDVKNLVMPHIALPEGLVQQMLKGDKTLSTAASMIINDEISKAFGTKVGEGYVLDKSKLTPENIASVGSRITQRVATEGVKIETERTSAALVSDVIKQMEKEQKVKFTPERVEKITKALAPTLAKLGPEYLEKHKGELTQGLVTSLKSEQSYSTSFTRSYTVSTSSLNKIATKLEKQHQPQADGASVKKIEGALIKNEMTNGDIATKLNSFAQKTGMTKDGKPLEYSAKAKPNTADTPIPSTADIAKMRQSNPKQFDSIFNAPKEQEIPATRPRSNAITAPEQAAPPLRIVLEPRPFTSKGLHELHDVRTAALAVALTNKKPGSKDYESYKQNLVNQLKESGEEIVGEPKPFYKIGVSSPAGYVIETNSEVLVCYHGTQFGKIFSSGGKEILHDLQISSAKMNFGGQEVSVHSGFKAEFESSKDSLYQVLAQTNLKEKGVHLSGHSLGGAVAQIAAIDLTTHFGITVNKVTTFGGPRVFTKDAAELYNSKGLGDVTLRIKQDLDPITRLVPRGMYHSTGNKIKLQSTKGGLHSGAVYRDIAMNKVTEQDIQNKRSSDKPWSFTESYLKPIIQMTKASFANLHKNTVGLLVNKIRQNLENAANKPVSNSPPPGRRSPINKGSGRGI